MKMVIGIVGIMVVVAVGLIPVFSQPVMADQGAERARQLLIQGEILPLQQIIDKAVAVKPGQLLETELEHDDGRYIYELEILDPHGQVWELELDARTGELLELENED